MKKTEKIKVIDNLVDILGEYDHFYITDTQGLNAGQTSALRRKCFENDVKMVVVKNTLFKLAVEKRELNVEELEEAFKGTSAVLFTNTGNAPAKLIKDFRKKGELPLLKGAYVEESIYVGDDQLNTLANIKSKEELIGDIVALLESPIKNVVSSLQSSGSTIHGILETLEKRN